MTSTLFTDLAPPLALALEAVGLALGVFAVVFWAAALTAP